LRTSGRREILKTQKPNLDTLDGLFILPTFPCRMKENCIINHFILRRNNRTDKIREILINSVMYFGQKILDSKEHWPTCEANSCSAYKEIPRLTRNH
jgi:hypothetical protein